MKMLFIAAACVLCTTAVAAEVTVSFANGTDQTFNSVTVYKVESGHNPGDALGQLSETLKPGESATVKLGLTQCQSVWVRAFWADDGAATIKAAACDPAFFTITED